MNKFTYSAYFLVGVGTWCNNLGSLIVLQFSKAQTRRTPQPSKLHNWKVLQVIRLAPNTGQSSVHAHSGSTANS